MSTPILYISKKQDGHMGVSAPKNRKKYFAKIGISNNSIVDIVVAHTNKIKVAGKSDGGKYFEGYDAIISKDKNLFLGLTVADCVPIAVFDPVGGSIGLIHAGWRGLLNGVIKKTILKTVNGKLENGKLIVYVGAHICQKHYEVGPEVAGKFSEYKSAIKKLSGRTYLDLGAVAKEQLIKVGVKSKNIQIDPICNYEDKTLFSYRGGDKKDRNLYLFGLYV